MEKINIFKERCMSGLKLIIFAAILTVFVITAKSGDAFADAPSVSVVSVNYYNSTLTVQLSSADKLLYISDSKMKSWELVPFTKNLADNRIVIDISWISCAKDNVISFKGDFSSTPIKVTIPKQLTNLKATYNIYSGIVTFTNAGYRKIEWKKKDGFTWKLIPYKADGTIDTDKFRDELQALSVNGATVLFRLASIEGTSAISTGARPGKEVQVAITKKSAAPTITVNDELVAIPVTKGMQYRYVDKYGNPDTSNPSGSAWITIEKSGNMLLKDIAAKAMYNEATKTKGEKVYIQFRTAATSTKQVSSTTTIAIPAQEPISEEALSGITFEYTSSTTFEIKVVAASETTPYEYCIINQDDVLDGITISDFENIKWKTISSKNAVVIDKTDNDVEDTSKVYVRRKAVYQLGHDDYGIASPILFLAEVKYPGHVNTEDKQLKWLQAIAGVCNPDNSDGYLTFTLYSPTKSTVSKLEFHDYSSAALCGTVTFNSYVTENADKSDPNKKYIITTTITSTQAIDKFADDTNTQKMLAYITVGSGEFKSSSTNGGIALYLHPASAVKNPADTAAKTKTAKLLYEAGYTEWSSYSVEDDKVGYTSAIERVVNSNRIYDAGASGDLGNFSYCDQNVFRVRVDFGTRYEPDFNTTVAGKVKNSEVTVTKIKYDGVTFVPGAVSKDSPFYVEYVNTRTDDNEKDLRFAVLTINANVIEKNSLIDDRNTATPIIIYLSNGEIIKNQVTMNLVETARLAKNYAMTNIEHGLKETETSTYVENGITYSKVVDVITYSISIKLFNSSYKASITDATWNGQSILKNTETDSSSGTYTINLDNKEINKIDVTKTESYNIVITFDNGFSITTGCKLTITASNN